MANGKRISGIRMFYYPCTISGTMAPNEVEVTVQFGLKEFSILAPAGKVDRRHGKIELSVVGMRGSDCLVSFPGEVQGGFQTALIPSKLLEGMME